MYTVTEAKDKKWLTWESAHATDNFDNNVHISQRVSLKEFMEAVKKEYPEIPSIELSEKLLISADQDGISIGPWDASEEFLEFLGDTDALPALEGMPDTTGNPEARKLLIGTLRTGASPESRAWYLSLLSDLLWSNVYDTWYRQRRISRKNFLEFFAAAHDISLADYNIDLDLTRENIIKQIEQDTDEGKNLWRALWQNNGIRQKFKTWQVEKEKAYFENLRSYAESQKQKLEKGEIK